MLKYSVYFLRVFNDIMNIVKNERLVLKKLLDQCLQDAIESSKKMVKEQHQLLRRYGFSKNDDFSYQGLR